MKKFIFLTGLLIYSWSAYAYYYATQTPIAQTATVMRWTPTPAQTIALCGTPFPAVFIQNPTPVLVATMAYEGKSVVEPNVIVGPDGILHMSYTANSWWNGGANQESICLATSSNGINWIRYGPVAGNGAAGITNPCGQSFQLHIGNEYRIYFSDETSKYVFYVTSTDGYTYTQTDWTKFQPVMGAKQFNPPCVGGAGLDGMGIFADGAGNYWSLIETVSDSCPEHVTYDLFLGKDISGNATKFFLASMDDLQGLRNYKGSPLGTTGGILQGGRATVREGNHYHTWYGAGYPTNIYHAESEDLYNWYTDSPSPVVAFTKNMFGLQSCNQAADASIVEYKGQTYLFYDGTDNYNDAAAIGYSKYKGTLAEYDVCYYPGVPISVLVIGGGGGGGSNLGGGGGAGGYVYNSKFYLNKTYYTVTVGNGGTGGSGVMAGSKGSDSIFSTIDAAGGGGGAGSSYSAGNGGCGGGGSALTTAGAAGSDSQGYTGGKGYYVSPCFGGGGGGGTFHAGGTEDDVHCIAGYGGTGTANNISGSLIYYGGGGGGGGGDKPNNWKNGLGGWGGGGDGGYYANSNGNDGKAKTGGGGGGAAIGSGTGGSGGSGIVIISYLTSIGRGTGGTISYNGSYTVHTFTSSGTFIPPILNTPTPAITPAPAIRLKRKRNLTITKTPIVTGNFTPNPSFLATFTVTKTNIPIVSQ